MPRKRQRGKRPHQKAWQPLVGGSPSGDYLERLRAASVAAGVPESELRLPDEVWLNDTYTVVVRKLDNGVRHLSIHRDDRRPIRDWRHLQQIKNEVCGDEAIGFEIFPPESRLVDSSNEFHLWVLPAGAELPFGFDDRYVVSAGEITSGRVRGEHRGRQRPWQHGLTTGRDRD